MNENKPNTGGRPGPSKKLHFALIRSIAALLIAAGLLAVTGLSAIELYRGPSETSAIQNEEQGAFVKRDIYAILGFYADEVSASGTVTARYALVPMDGKLVSVCLTGRYLESADAVLSSTYDYFNGKTQALDSYFVVQGTVGKPSEDNSALMYDWFGLNRSQLVEIGFIADTDDYADYLSDHVLLVDTVNGRSQNTVIWFSAIAGLFLLYMLVELVLMGVGFYLSKPEKVLDGCVEAGCVCCNTAPSNAEDSKSEALDKASDSPETPAESSSGDNDAKEPQ